MLFDSIPHLRYDFRIPLLIHPFQSAELMNLECLVFSRFLLFLKMNLAQVGVKTHHLSVEAKMLMVLVEVKGRFDDALASLIELGN
ncbi:hypothetical protein PIB30_026323 [Stylosanthes scabra]|uniref:Uncharacterized protein n=1 Tax=Stylosanthes scabra TaxID=79078 RepID=A0ABU6X7W9_9FABA|nr:hypothetical protein [Stylosanthes scabra]